MESDKLPVDSRPLTFAELRVMALRYADNAQIKLLVDGAMNDG